MSHIKITLACILFCVLADEATAGRWKVRKGLDINAEYSGNVFLEAADTQKDMMLSTRARLNVTRRGGRASASISYAPELRYFVNGTQGNQVVHHLNAVGDIELIERVFGIRASARAGQTIIDPNQPFTQDSFTNPDNVTDTYSLSIKPYLLPIRLGDYATLDMGINFGVVVNSASEVQDSLGRDASVNLASGPYFTRFTWNLASQHTLTSYENEDGDEIFANLTASANYRLSRKWQLNSNFGYDNNDVRTTRDINGFFWRLGATYTPHSRASLAVGVGERYNSADYNLAFSYRHRNTAWSANYSRDLQTARDEFLERAIFPETDQFGNPITDPTLDQATYQLLPGAPLNETVFIADRFNLGMSWRRRRTSLSLNTAYVRRDDLRIDNVTRDWSFSLNLGRGLSPKSSANLSGSWLNHIDDMEGDNDYQQWAAGLNYSYRMSQHMSMNLGYQYTIRDARSGDDFSEDRLRCSLNTSY